MSARVIPIQVGELTHHSTDSEGTQAGVLRAAVMEYEGMLLGYAQTLLGEWELARDVVQDTFIRLHRELKSAEPENLKAWLFTVCRNRSLDMLRKAKRVQVTDTEILEAAVDDAQPSPASVVAQHDEHERAMSLLSHLPKNQQEVIRLKFQGDLSYKEISDVTGLSVGNVGYLLHHGLKRLRELMREPNFEPSTTLSHD